MKPILCDSVLLKNRELNIQDKYILYLKKKTKLIGPCQFSSDEFIFKPTKEDWKIAKRTILTFLLYLTDNCNSNCNICFEKDSRSKYNFNEIKYENLIKILKHIGKNKKVILFGGEPTLRKDIFDIIRLIKKSGNFVEIYTNGLKLYDLKYVKKLKEAGIEKVHLSFDGFKNDIYDSMRNGSNQLKIKLKALKNLEKCSIEVYLSATIARGINDDQISSLLMFTISNKHFIKGLTLLGLTPFSNSCNIKAESFMTVFDILDILEMKAVSNIKKYYIEFEKFKININKILNKININNFPISTAGTPFKIHNNRLEEFIPFKDLKQINKNIEDGEIMNIFKYFIKKFDLKYLMNLWKIPKLVYKMEKNDILLLHVFNVLNELNYKPMRKDIICISEKNNELFFLNYGAGT